MDQSQQPQHQEAPNQAVSPQQPQAQATRPEPQGQQPQADQRKTHDRKDEKSGRFGQAALEAKRQAAIAALRAERGVSEPAAPVQTQVPETLSTNAQMAAVHSIPNSEEYKVQGMSNAQIQDVLARYDAKIAEQRALETQIAQREASVAAKAAEAQAKLAKIEQAKGDPLQFLAEVGITDQEWQQMLVGGGELSPEQKRIKELEAKLDGFMQQSAQKEAEARAQAMRQAAQGHISANPLTKMMANPDAVIAHQEAMSKKTGREVSMQEAVSDLTNTYKQGVMALLNNPEIAAMLNLSVPKPQSGPAGSNSPTTLGSRLASSTTPSAGKPGPTDWAAKRKLFLDQVAAMKRNQ